MVTSTDLVEAPQPLSGTVYVIVATPIVLPVTATILPSVKLGISETLPVLVLDNHVPPAVTVDKVIVLYRLTNVVPVIAATGVGKGITVTVIVLLVLILVLFHLCQA